jgi:FtsP/CotA-like multicopper oxidase with cupredoxin domain
MRRSRFVAAAGGGMLALALPLPTRRALAADVVDYTLTAAPLRISPARGVSFDALAYNGTVPGPVLRVQNGQRIRAKYVNHCGVSTTVHWHGMILPNDMDGAAGVTQKSVLDGGTFLYEFAAGPSGTRWYHDHDMNMGLARGLFGMIVVEDPRDDRADAEFALVFHDVPNMRSFDQALRAVSTAPMTDPLASPELLGMRADDKMSDEVAYIAHWINGASYPQTAPLAVKVGQRVRLRILNANLTQTRYVRLAGHRLRVTHGDGNPLERPVEVDALRVGVAERYDAWFEVTRPGAWLLQGLSSDPLAFEQAVVVHTEGIEHATALGSPQSLDGVDYFTYEKAAGVAASALDRTAQLHKALVLNGGDYGIS